MTNFLRIRSSIFITMQFSPTLTTWAFLAQTDDAKVQISRCVFFAFQTAFVAKSDQIVTISHAKHNFMRNYYFSTTVWTITIHRPNRWYNDWRQLIYGVQTYDPLLRKQVGGFIHHNKTTEIFVHLNDAVCTTRKVYHNFTRQDFGPRSCLSALRVWYLLK